MEQIISTGELISNYSSGKNLLEVPKIKVLWGRVDNSILKVMGDKEYNFLTELGVINPKKITRKNFILSLRTANTGFDLKHHHPENQQSLDIKLRELEELKEKLLLLGIDFASYGEQEVYLLNAVRTLQNTFKDVLIEDEDILHFVLCLVAVNAAHEVLWAGFDFRNKKSEYVERSSTNMEQ